MSIYKQAFNNARVEEISSYCLFIVNQGQWISATILDKDYAISTLHCFPKDFQNLNNEVKVLLQDKDHKVHNCHVHAVCSFFDYVVFKKDDGDGQFEKAPNLATPGYLDKYILAGFPFDEGEIAFRTGAISTVPSSAEKAFYYGDSGGLPGFSGGGVFYSKSGSLLGIARGGGWEGKETNVADGDVLQIISALTIAQHIKINGGRRFSYLN